MKFAGFDGIVIARENNELRIEDDEVGLEDADSLWGKGIFETERSLEEEMGFV